MIADQEKDGKAIFRLNEVMVRAIAKSRQTLQLKIHRVPKLIPRFHGSARSLYGAHRSQCADYLTIIRVQLFRKCAQLVSSRWSRMGGAGCFQKNRLSAAMEALRVSYQYDK
jgi:hypothetical protein